MGISPAIYDKLKEIRLKKDLKLQPNKYLKNTIIGYDGVERPFSLRSYQVQMIIHLLSMNAFVVGDDMGLGKCRPLNNSLQTNKGVIKLQDLYDKDMLEDSFIDVSSKELSVWNGTKWTPITKFYFGGLKPTVKLKTSRGYEIEGTFNHLLWGVKGEKSSFHRMGDLSLGDSLCLVRNYKFPDHNPPIPYYEGLPSVMTEDLAYVLGFILGEAWVNHEKIINVFQDTTYNKDLALNFQSKLNLLFNMNKEFKNNKLNITSKSIRSFFEGLGLDRCVSKDKRVPDLIFSCTKSVTASFLRAFFDAEASFCSAVLEVSSASIPLLKQIQNLLLRFGITSTLKSKKIKGREHLYGVLSLTGDSLPLYYSEIGFDSERKSKGMSDYLNSCKHNTNKNTIPHIKNHIEAFRSALVLVWKKH
jgi:intein/homing endonuclease